MNAIQPLASVPGAPVDAAGRGGQRGGDKEAPTLFSDALERSRQALSELSPQEQPEGAESQPRVKRPPGRRDVSPGPDAAVDDALAMPAAAPVPVPAAAAQAAAADGTLAAGAGAGAGRSTPPATGPSSTSPMRADGPGPRELPAMTATGTGLPREAPQGAGSSHDARPALAVAAGARVPAAPADPAFVFPAYRDLLSSRTGQQPAAAAAEAATDALGRAGHLPPAASFAVATTSALQRAAEAAPEHVFPQETESLAQELLPKKAPQETDASVELRPGAELQAAVSAGPGAPSSPTPADRTARLAPIVGSSEWAPALGHQLVRLGPGGSREVELNLNPAHLGPLKVTLSVNDNQAQIMFTSDHAAVRHAVEAALPQLRTSFADNGISLGQASVGSGSPEHRRDGLPGQDQPGQRRPAAAAASGGVTPDLSEGGGIAALRAQGSAVDMFA